MGIIASKNQKQKTKVDCEKYKQSDPESKSETLSSNSLRGTIIYRSLQLSQTWSQRTSETQPNISRQYSLRIQQYNSGINHDFQRPINGNTVGSSQSVFIDANPFDIEKTKENVFIFSQYKFSNFKHKTRDGNEMDVKSLEKVFQNKKKIFKDYTLLQIKNEMKRSE